MSSQITAVSAGETEPHPRQNERWTVCKGAEGGMGKRGRGEGGEEGGTGRGEEACVI